MHDGPRATDSQTRAPASEAGHARTDRLLALIGELWPDRLPHRPTAGLPASVLGALRLGPQGASLARALAHLDRSLPGWAELGASAVAQAAPHGLDPHLQRLCLLLARRPLARPDPVLAALDGCSSDSDSCFWLLVALAGTDTAAVRAAWLKHLRQRVGSEPAKPDRALWFAFLRAFLGGWLTYSDFRECLLSGRVLAAAHPKGDYRPALRRLGLASNPTFSKWYRQVVYDVAHQPDVSLSFSAGGWIRDFPGEDYLWQALARLRESPGSWWPLYVLRWTSGVDPEDERVIARLRGTSPTILCIVSLLRPDLCSAAARALDDPNHQSAIRWLKTAAPGRPLDLPWVQNALLPWTQAVGEAFTLAMGALCSVDPPADFPGPQDEVIRRREFVRSHLLPEFDRVMDHLCCLHALRRQHFDVICRQARKGSPGAVRALALWPEKAEEAAPLLFRLTREGAKLARQAARESLDILKAQAKVADIADLEKRLDLAAAWADAGLDGKPARIWWDVAGCRVKLSVAAGKVTLHTYSGKQRLAGIPKNVRADPQYPEIRQSRAELARSYRYFRRRFEQAMFEGVRYTGRDFAVLLSNPVVRSLVSRLVILRDGSPFLWTPSDPLDEQTLPPEIEQAACLSIAHPLDLAQAGVLSEWQQRVIDSRIAQPFKQVFREIYLIGERERASSHCSRFAGHSLIARRAFALLRTRGYSPQRGDAVKDWPAHSVRVHVSWAQTHENAGRLLAQAEAAESVTTGPVWFETQAGDQLALARVEPVVFSETMRDADLLVSRAPAGELGFTSEETRRLRSTLVRYLARTLGLTTVYVSEEAAHVIVEGQRAMYRVHLGSGSVFLENTRRHLDMGDLASDPVHELVAESQDSLTARILGIIGALTQDDRITNTDFLSQLPHDNS